MSSDVAPAAPGATQQTAPSTTLRVTLLQEASGLDPAGNRARLTELAGHLAGEGHAPDLMVLPEAFARDFGPPGSDVAPFAEPLDGPFAQALAAAADATGAHVLAGMFETGDDVDHPFNTLLLAGPAGERAGYRKIHLYDSFGYRESDRLGAGVPAPTVVDVAGWRVGLMTCYDLRFPELARALVDAGAEVLVVPAAWVAGERKADHWRTLVRARAIENTVFVVACGQPGPRYTGRSLAVDPLGDVLAKADDAPARLDVVLERSALDEARRVNPSLANRRL